MGSKFEFDETRDAIGANSMDDQERKEMLERFKSAGGEIKSDREVKPPGSEEPEDNRPRRRAGGGGGGDHEIKTPSQMYREKRRAEAEKKAKAREEWDKARQKLSSPSAKFFIKLRCMFQGLTPFSLAEARPKFMNFLALEVKQGLVNLNLIGNEFFLKDRALANKIVRSLDQKNPMLMEVLETAHTLYKGDDLAKLIENIQSTPNSNTPLHPISDNLKAFFLQLYYIYPFQETLKRAISLAFEIYKGETSNDTDVQRVDILRKRVLKDIKNVFQVGFSRLFQLICRVDNVDYPPFSPILEKAIGLDPAKRLGKRKRGDKSDLEGSPAAEEDSAAEEETESTEQSEEAAEGSGEKKEEEKKEKKEEKPKNAVHATKEYQYGSSLMNMYRLPDLRKKTDPQGRFASIPYRDKVFLAFMFFNEYDHEYSFVQTTNKIKLNADYAEGSKTDYRQILADLYNNSRDIIRAFEKYDEALKELNQLKKKKQSSNYIEQSKLETKQEKNVDVEARNTRGLIRTYMGNVAKNLALLISDMKGERNIVGNMDEPVTFDKGLEGKKRLNGKLVKQCIMEAYCYSLALKERLETGDLYGGVIQMTDEEMVASFGSTFEEKKAQPQAEGDSLDL